MEEIVVESIVDQIRNVLPGVKAVFGDDSGQLTIDMNHGMGINYKSLVWLSDVLGTKEIHLQRTGPEQLKNDNTWTPEHPCRLVCGFYGVI